MNLFNFICKKKKKNQPKIRTMILDTSALNSKKSMEIIEEKDAKIILLTGTILEMDNWKHAKGTFGNNVRALSRRCREDQKSEKIICVSGYNKYSYQDKNIIDYCRDNPDVTIIAGDNNLCNLAKAFGIPYIYVEEEKDEEERVNQEINQEIDKKLEKESHNGIYFFDRSIRFIPKKGFYTSIRLETEDGITKTLDSYKEGDLIYEILSSKKGKYMEINKYKVTSKNDFFEVKKVEFIPIHYMNEIFKSCFSEGIQEEILRIFKEKSTY